MTGEDLTPFKHTECGGVIAKERGRFGVVYRCTQWGSVSGDIDNLLLTETFIRASMEVSQEKDEK